MVPSCGLMEGWKGGKRQLLMQQEKYNRQNNDEDDHMIFGIRPEKGGAMVNGDAVKASAGALNRIKVCREYNLKNTIQYLKESGFTVAGCTEKAPENCFNVNLNKPLCLIMGSEEDGISPEYL